MADSLPFKILDNKKTYTKEPQIETLAQGDKILVTVSKQFPNPGYNMEVTDIIEDDSGEYKVTTKTIPPDPKKIHPQVITYQTIKIEIDKNDLPREAVSFYLER